MRTAGRMVNGCGASGVRCRYADSQPASFSSLTHSSRRNLPIQYHYIHRVGWGVVVPIKRANRNDYFVSARVFPPPLWNGSAQLRRGNHAARNLSPAVSLTWGAPSFPCLARRIPARPRRCRERFQRGEPIL